MRKHAKILLNCSIFALLPFVANAAGTYYNRTYEVNPGAQYNNYESGTNSRYGQGYGQEYNPAYAYGNVRYAETSQTQTRGGYYGNNYNARNNQRRVQTQGTQSDNEGLRLNAGLSHQFAWWTFDMKNAGSKLHFDDINWNVFDVSGVYDFYVGNTKMRVGAGGQYGMQYGDSTMVDDDITSGGYGMIEYDGVGTYVGRALSVGTSNDGSLMGFNVELGLTDFWRSGNLKITPSFGYRSLEYKLETKNNYGISIDTLVGAPGYCDTRNGETQCVSLVYFVDQYAQYWIGDMVSIDFDEDGEFDLTAIQIPENVLFVDTANNYYYHQDGVTHSYETTWAGPYLALDMEYKMTDQDVLNGRVELGLPSYTSTGDQPYRPDLQHSKSFEDKGSIGDAYHFGMGANWMHALSDSVMLTLGMTFDYYHVSGADATTYFDGNYYITHYRDPAVAENDTFASAEYYGTSNYNNWTEQRAQEIGRDLAEDKASYMSNLATIAEVDGLQAAGWKSTSDGEIESLYKSMGIRLGIQAKF